MRADEELAKLQGQLDLIVEAMRKRHLALARKITDEVIEYQLSTTRPINAAKTLCNLASKARDLGIHSLQLELTERAVQIAGDDGWSWARYADALLKSQRPEEALRAYEQAKSFGAGAIASIGRAVTLSAMGRLSEALTAYDEAVALHPESVVAKNGRAETLKAMGRISEALEAYDSIAAEHPENVAAKNGRAEMLRRLGRLSEALEAYDSAAAQHPEDVVIRNGRAETLREMGRLNEALEAYDSVVVEYPEDLTAQTGRAKILESMGQLGAALDAYDSIIAQRPEDMVTMARRGTVLQRLRRYDEALAAYQSAYELSLKQRYPLMQARFALSLGGLYRQVERLDEALRYYQQALEMFEMIGDRSGVAAALGNLGHLHHAALAELVGTSAARFKEALAAFSRSHAIYQELGDQRGVAAALAGRGMVFQSMGNFDEAVSALEESLRLSPDDEDVRRRLESISALGRRPDGPSEVA